MHRMTSKSMFTKQQNITETVRKTATASTLLNMLDAFSTRLKKIHGLHHYKYGMMKFKTHVELMLIGCIHKMQ